MTLLTALNILFAAGMAFILCVFWICCGYVRLKSDEHVFIDEEFGRDVRGVLGGVARLSFWLMILSVIKMFF